MTHSPKEIAEYFLKVAADHDRVLTPMQVLKLVYIAHGWELGLNSRPLVDESVEAWQYGPVIPSLYREYKRFGGGPVKLDPEVYPNVSPSEAKIMDEVWEGYGSMSGLSLSSLTHEAGSPWDLTVKSFGLGAVIQNELIQDYYHRLATR